MIIALIKLRRAFEGLTRPVKQGILLAVDVVLGPITLLLAFLITAPATLTSIDPVILGAYSACISTLTVIVALLLGIPKIKLKSYEGIGALKSSAVGIAATAGLYVQASSLNWPLPSVTLAFFMLTFVISMVLIRFTMLHLLLAFLSVGHARRNVLIYGAGTTGSQLATALRGHDGIRVVGLIDDSPALQGMSILGLSVHGPEKLDALVRKHDVDRILLAMPSASQARQAAIARKLMERGLDVHSLPSFAQLVGTETLADTLVPVTPGKFLNRPAVIDLHPEAESAYRGKSILVTGAGGSVGSELCRQLLQYQPRKIVMFEVSEHALYQIDKELSGLPEAATIEFVPVLGSVTEYRLVRAVCSQHQIDVILHAAAYKHVPLVEANPLSGIVNNVLGTRTVAEAALYLDVKRFILISTDKAVRPTNVMGASKRLAELVVQDLAQKSENTDFSIVRFGNVLGSSGSVVPLFREQIARGGPITLTHEDVTRYFMTISEAARLVLIAGGMSDNRRDVSGDLFVLDMGQPIKIRDLAERMISAAGCTLKSEDNPNGEIEIVVTGLRPGEKLHEELLIEPGMLITPHEKILRARERSLTSLEVSSALRELRSAVATGNTEAAFEVMETYVEGYAERRVKQVKQAAQG